MFGSIDRFVEVLVLTGIDAGQLDRADMTQVVAALRVSAGSSCGMTEASSPGAFSQKSKKTKNRRPSRPSSSTLDPIKSRFARMPLRHRQHRQRTTFARLSA